MKRFLVLALICLLAACSNQHRVDPEPDFADPDPKPDETPEPRQGEIGSLISRARLDVKTRDYDEARVKLHQVFRRDRWNPEANTLYQDIRIQQGQGDALYQEYLDLYEKNKERGDALWFHLRPLLIKRGIKACDVEKHSDFGEPYQRELKLIINEEIKKPDVGPDYMTRKLRDAVLDLLKNADPAIHFPLIDAVPTKFRKELRAVYEELASDNPGSGDSQFLHAYVVGMDEARVSLDMLRKTYILELPGVYPLWGIGSIAEVMGLSPEFGENKRSTDRDIEHQWRGWLHIAYHFLLISEKTRPEGSFAADRKRVSEYVAKSGLTLEDLSQRK